MTLTAEQLAEIRERNEERKAPCTDGPDLDICIPCSRHAGVGAAHEDIDTLLAALSHLFERLKCGFCGEPWAEMERRCPACKQYLE